MRINHKSEASLDYTVKANTGSMARPSLKSPTNK